MPNIDANTFGQYLFGDLLGVPIITVTEFRWYEGLQAFIARLNQYLGEMSALLADTGTDVQTGYNTGGGGDFQKLSDRGGVEATRRGQRWFVGFPIYSFGDRSVYELGWVKRALFGDLAADILDKTRKDIRLQFKQLLTGVLNNANFTFDDTKWPGRNAGTTTVCRLANNDGSVGSVYGYNGEIALGTLNHYLTSGSNSVTLNAFTGIRAALRNVNHDQRIVYIASRTTCDSAESLTGSLADSFSLPVQPDLVDILGKYAKPTLPGLFEAPQYRGRIARGSLVEMPMFPDGYVLGLDLAAEKPLRVRVSDLADEQGLQLVQDSDRPETNINPLVNKYWRRIMGVGARNRVNGVVMQVTTSGTYTAPTI